MMIINTDSWADKRNKTVNVIIETPKGSRNKYTYQPEKELFILKKVLPEGMSFPYDFGFIPKTKAPDGDPVDIMVLMDEPAFTGCLVEARLIGMIELSSRDVDGKKFTENNRLLGIPVKSRSYKQIRTLSDLGKNLLKEIEFFFLTYSQIEEKVIRISGRKSPAQAAKYIEEKLIRIN
jgi:inorganic pyrophosphatase